MMERILSDFRRRRCGMLLRCVICAVVIFAIAWVPLAFSGEWAEWIRIVWLVAAAAVSLVAAVLLLRAFTEILCVATSRLKCQLDSLPESEKNEIIAAYPTAKTLGERWFLPEHILFYTYRRAVIFRYDEIMTISPGKNGDLLLTTSHGDITMPVRNGENGGMIYAVLRSRNPDIRAEFGGTSEEAGKVTERT